MSQSVPFQNSQISKYGSTKGNMQANISNKLFVTNLDQEKTERKKVNDALDRKMQINAKNIQPYWNDP